MYTLSIRCRFGVLKAERIGGIYRDKTYFYEIKPIMPFIPHYHRTVSRPLSDLFSWAYKKAETIIRDKAQSLERENLNQTKNDIESLCLNMIQASDYLISLNNYGVLYRESATKGYSYLKCWQDANEQIQNVNNSLLNSNADISVLSNDQTALLHASPAEIPL